MGEEIDLYVDTLQTCGKQFSKSSYVKKKILNLETRNTLCVTRAILDQQYLLCILLVFSVAFFFFLKGNMCHSYNHHGKKVTTDRFFRFIYFLTWTVLSFVKNRLVRIFHIFSTRQD